ncbi:hypothetical protein H0H92_004495 [Tricholoma furcatifolium]|nr:hypothetical protein H0H92_004495 [Tricholoma furcatifolium]
MTSNANANATETPGHLSSTSTVSPTWAPPKSPLPPHRLAKLANALGVSTPLPAVHQPTSLMTRTYLESPTPSSEVFRRSPTPSTPGTNFSAYTTVSKYLLHVIPPLHLPHDTDDDDMTPPPPTASGYHTQFRRGTLVPVHPTLQSQLVAIAKEYALPSTTGLILFLVASPKSPQSGVSPGNVADEIDEPGPRLSEDIWKHLWIRVLKAERDDTLSLRSPLGMTLGTQSTPYLPNESIGRPLRPLLSSTSDANAPNFSSNPFPSSPTTASTVSNSRSAPPSESSACEPETPDTSSAAPSILKDPETRANSLDLPGLMSPSIIPILAKVEFDIDRRKAAWYEPWLRSRKLNHAKRAESRHGKPSSRENSGENSDGSQDPRHIGLLIGNKEAQSALSLPVSSNDDSSVLEPEADPLATTSDGYEQLEEEEEIEEESGGGWSDDSDDDFESTDRVTTLTLANHKDALADVFGTDAETWAALKSASPRNSKRITNPNVVELALDAADLTALPSPTESELEHLGKEEDEVQALLDQMSRSESDTASPGSSKKHVPPPLTLITSPSTHELTIPALATPTSATSGGLAYLDESLSAETPNEHDDMDFGMDYTRMKSPAETEKREGAVFDDLDLGLDPAEDYDESDPHDRRRSQFLMRAQLDEIERTMAQFSPRILQTDLADEQQYLPFSPSNSLTLSPGNLNADHYPPSPRLPSHPEVPDSPGSQPRAAWPATPFSSLKDTSAPQRSDGPPSPPRLAVNGVSTSAPKSFRPGSSGGLSAESESRRREHEAEQGYSRPHIAVEKYLDSPVIPLSPDPFGRFSSTSPSPGQTSTYWEKDALPGLPAVDSLAALNSPDNRTRSSSATSRFSADSITGVEANSNANKPNRATLTVNTFKKLWRKSTKSSTQPPTPSSASFSPVPAVPPVPPVPAGHPSQEQSDEPPKTPIFGRFSPQPAAPLRPQDAPPPVPQAPIQLSVPIPPRRSQDTQPPIPQALIPAAVTPHRSSSLVNEGTPSREVPPPVPQVHTQLSVPATPRRSQDAPPPVPQAVAQLPPPVTPQSQRPMPQLQPQPQLQPSASPLHPQRSPIPQPQLSSGPQHRSPTGMPYAAPPGPPAAAIPQQFAPPPLFNGRINNAQPIVAAQMRPGRSNSTMAHFEFDQESPYPITRRPTTSSKAGSPPPAQSPSLQAAQLPPSTPTMTNGSLPPMGPPTTAQQEKPGTRKSILKGWKSSSISSVSSQQTATPAEPRTSFERPNANAIRTKRPNGLNFGSSRSDVSSPLPDIPPSPQIPQQFIGQNHNRQSMASRLTKSSTDLTHSPPQLSKQLSVGSTSSTRRSMTSSRSSQDSRPSFDTSQFEMVSPKMGSAPTYPHHLDHSMDHSSVEGH